MTEIGNFGQQPMAKSRSVRLILRSVITPARKHVEAISRAFDLDLAEAAVAGRVRGVVAQGGLGAQLFGELVESFLELFFVAHDDRPSAGFFRHLAGDALVVPFGGAITRERVDPLIAELR